MTRTWTFRSSLSILLALVLLALPALPAGTASAAEAGVSAASAAPASSVDSFDYFSRVYGELNDPNHVLKTATYEDIAHLFDSEGRFAVLFGGSWSAETQGSIGYINEVAKQYGVKTLYNFDTKLDGDRLDIADSASPYAYKYVDLVNKYLKNLSLYDKNDPSLNVSYTNGAGEKVAANKVAAPFLFVYDKSHVDAQGSPAPIVAFLNGGKSRSELETGGTLDPAKVDAFKNELRHVFSAAGSFSAYDESAYIKDAFNRNYLGENPGKPAIFTEGDGPLVYEHVTYHQLKQILASDGNYVFLFGGSWCPNTQAIIKYADAYAKTYGVDKIYFFDTKLDGGLIVGDPANNTGADGKATPPNPHYNNELQIRTTNHPYAKLYVDLVRTYLTNIKTENNTAANPSVISYVDENGQTVKGDRLQVPYLFAYNKSNVDADGKAAPILGHVELMYSWTNIQPDYASSGYAVGARYTNSILALKSLYSRLQSVPQGLSAAPPSAPGAADGRIDGAAGKALEYKAAADSDYRPVDGDRISGLAPGAYQVRYAAKPGYQGPTTPAGAKAIPYAAGPSITVTVPAYGQQAPPSGLTGVAPTTPDNKDGRITGTTAAQQYKLSTVSDYVYATDRETAGLAPGTYQVRFAAKEGYKASPATEVVVPAYAAPSTGGPSGGTPSVPTAPPAEEKPSVETAESGNTVTATASAKAAVDASGSVTTATIDADVLAGLKEAAQKAEAAGKQAVIRIRIDAAAGTKTAQLTLDRASFDAIAAATKASIRIEAAGFASVAFDAAAVRSVSEAADRGAISLSVARVSLGEEGKAVLGDRPVYELSISAGASPVSSFGGGKAKVVVPYALQSGEDRNAILVYAITESGELAALRGGFSASGGSVSFETGHFSAFIVAHNKVAFSDVASSSWYGDAVGYLAARGIAAGTDSSRFSPDAAVTRGQFAVLLLKALGIEPEAAGADNFVDAGSAYYTGYLAAAKKLGIAAGSGDNRFLPNQSITRQELFTLLYRSLDTLGELGGPPQAEGGSALSGFADAGQVSVYAQEALQALTRSGLVQGSGGKLEPKAPTTRAQAAQVLYNLLSTP
ncbi:putative membrane protein [Paenibacillus pasadenensis]|uniref:Putative membrane protein n=1 Tax=Paenibacillus pasadenensis TaxID=217090 RepID=A0A2N5NCA9_9BACL|nr:S-layer homology domain-containing protein [Paenibacillus pasadenensis]PLT47996.1 putative membrane protein [Paenibacillus pasadenensis]